MGPSAFVAWPGAAAASVLGRLVGGSLKIGSGRMCFGGVFKIGSFVLHLILRCGVGVGGTRMG